MKAGYRVRTGAVLFFLCGVASATTLLNVTDTLNNTDPVQTGRLARAGVAQDWAGTESFPGVLDPVTQFFYQSYSVNVGANTFVRISLDDVGVDEFASAYVGTYLPDSAGPPNFGFNTNWLGDAGASGNVSGVNPRVFQVIVPANSNLVVVVNTVTGGATLPVTNGTYNLRVEGFIDQRLDEAPEPSGAILMTTALGALGFALVRRRKAAALLLP